MTTNISSATVARNEKQRAYYADRAENYDSAIFGGRANRCHRHKIERIYRWLNVTAGQRVLEVGAGTGIHAEWLLELCPLAYSGVDLSAEMLGIARQRLGDAVELEPSPAECLPFADGGFDGVYCSSALHHFSDMQQAIAEMKRVVKPGGRIVLSEPNPGNPINLYKALSDPIERGVLAIRPQNFRRWSRAVGLRQVHNEFFNFTPPKPTGLGRVFDGVDATLAKLPLVRRIASMYLFVMEADATTK